MASNIVNTVPATGSALIAKPLRDNFAAAKSEIEALQLLAITNGNSHNHTNGAGGQIAYTSLSGLPTLGTAAADGYYTQYKCQWMYNNGGTGSWWISLSGRDTA